ncbi:MAG: CHRD domain-containing protein, partial [Planctomycetota bacterium]
TVSDMGVDASAFQTQLLAGETYFNFHTPAFPAGAIRGQIVSEQLVVVTPVAVPEPGSLAVVGLASLCGLGMIRRRRR